MNKINLVTALSFSICSTLSALSQAVPPRVQIINASDTIPPNYSKAEKTIRLKIRLQISGDYDTTEDANNNVSFSIINGTLPGKFKINGKETDLSPQFINSSQQMSVHLSKSDFPGADKFNEVSIFLDLKIQDLSDAKLSGFNSGQIIIKDHPSSFHSIIVSDAVPTNADYNPNKPFWIEIGSNFDLLDGLEPNNLFAGVFFHKRDIRKLSLKKEKNRRIWTKEQKNLGVFAGVFESKTISTLTKGDFGLRQYYDSSSFTPAVPNQPDSIWIFRGTGPIANIQTVRNVGLFFSPQLRLSNGSANEDGLHFFYRYGLNSNGKN